jgi:hypothetical protein
MTPTIGFVIRASSDAEAARVLEAESAAYAELMAGHREYLADIRADIEREELQDVALGVMAAMALPCAALALVIVRLVW